MKTASLVAAIAACSLSAMASAAVESAQFGGAYTQRFGETSWATAQPVSSFVGPAYDTTNYVTTGATGFGVGATSSITLNRTYGDTLSMSGGIGSTLDTFAFTVFCSGSSAADLVSATETIAFYRLSDSSFIGGFTVTLGPLAKGYYTNLSLTSLSSLGITFDTNDVLVTQQLSNVVGATRMGVAFGSNNTSPAPAVGTTTAGLYITDAATAPGLYTFTGSTANSNGVFQVGVVPAPGAMALLGVAGLVGGRRRRS